MTKFKVGELIEFTDISKLEEDANNTVCFTENKIYEIESLSEAYGFYVRNDEGDLFLVGSWELHLVERVKKSKNQRITALENEVAELRPLKNTVTELQKQLAEIGVIVEKVRKPSIVVQEALTTATSSVEDIIEFEGKQYKKVDREAREGDVIIVKKLGFNLSDYIKTQKPYMVLRDKMITDEDSSGYKGTFKVYAPEYGRTPETVDVYELIVEDISPVEKSPNQQRAEIIDKAKVFIDENGGDDYNFDIDEKNGTVFAYKVITPSVGRYAVKHGFSKCHPNDVFNTDIGKVISFGRAEKLDVSEFEQAVQPERAPEQIALYGSKVVTFKDSSYGVCNSSKGTVHYNSNAAKESKIINDTNAIYSNRGVE